MTSATTADHWRRPILGWNEFSTQAYLLDTRTNASAPEATGTLNLLALGVAGSWPAPKIVRLRDLMLGGAEA